MDPVCFYIGSRPIYWYGVMIAGAYLASVLAWSLLGRREGRGYAYASDLGFWLLLAGILGARAAYVVANWRSFRAEPWSVIRIDQGGLIYYGGFIAATAAAIVFARLRREPLLTFGDFAITSLPLGQAIGRVGCFLNGCCYGSACSLPWSVWAEGCQRHPTQLYEAVINLAIYIVLVAGYRMRHRPGRIFAGYLMLYPTARFALEFLRGDPRMTLLGLHLAQWLSVLLFAAGMALWLAAPPRSDASQDAK